MTALDFEDLRAIAKRANRVPQHNESVSERIFPKTGEMQGKIREKTL
jgi:hypothetical protein